MHKRCSWGHSLALPIPPYNHLHAQQLCRCWPVLIELTDDRHWVPVAVPVECCTILLAAVLCWLRAAAAAAAASRWLLKGAGNSCKRLGQQLAPSLVCTAAVMPRTA